MSEHAESLDNLLTSLQERAKELNCLYAIEELLGKPDAQTLEDWPDSIYPVAYGNSL